MPPRIDARQSDGDVHNANLSDKAAPLDHADSDKMPRDSGAGDAQQWVAVCCQENIRC